MTGEQRPSLRVVAGLDEDGPRREGGGGPPSNRLIVSSPGDPLPNARRFVKARYSHPKRDLLVCHGGAFYAWDGACWPEVEDRGLRSDIYASFGDAWYHNAKGEEVPFQPTRSKVTDLIDALKAAVHLPVEVSAPAWLGDNAPIPEREVVACANGLLHVPTRALHPHSPSFYVHHAVPFAYEPGATAPTRWLSFLDELWGEDEQSIDTLQETFGYLISGDTSLQKLFLMVGPKRSGKGTIGRVLTGLLGKHHVAGPTLSSLSTGFGLWPLIGKAAAIVSDARLRSGQEVLTERLLSVSGEDILTVDRKYLDHWTGKLPTRFLILTNVLPQLTDSSGALASRFVVLRLTRSFYGVEDTQLTDALLAELPGIFNWSLDGLERLQRRGHFVQPDTSAGAIRELEDLGSPMAAFVRDRCRVEPGQAVAVDTLFMAWCQWCDAQGRNHPGTKQGFGRDLRAVVPGISVSQPRGDGHRERHYEGIGLVSLAELRGVGAIS